MFNRKRGTNWIYLFHDISCDILSLVLFTMLGIITENRSNSNSNLRVMDYTHTNMANIVNNNNNDKSLHLYSAMNTKSNCGLFAQRFNKTPQQTINNFPSLLFAAPWPNSDGDPVPHPTVAPPLPALLPPSCGPWMLGKTFSPWPSATTRPRPTVSPFKQRQLCRPARDWSRLCGGPRPHLPPR